MSDYLLRRGQNLVGPLDELVAEEHNEHNECNGEDDGQHQSGGRVGALGLGLRGGTGDDEKQHIDAGNDGNNQRNQPIDKGNLRNGLFFLAHGAPHVILRTGAFVERLYTICNTMSNEIVILLK